MRTAPLLALALFVTTACWAPVPEDSGSTSTEPADCTPIAWFTDNDGDGWGLASEVTVSCEPVLHAVTQAGDCDDNDILVHPDRTDDCSGRDDDCDGQVDEDATLRTWYADQDGDNVGGDVGIQACAQPPGFVAYDGDCDDDDAAVYPQAPERCNGVDDDCDGAVPSNELDGDLDGFSACEGDCDDANPARSPAAPEVCNRQDDDCDGQFPLDEFDLDGDGQSPCEGDCDDTDPLILFGGIEFVADGLDTDCDGTELCFLDADGDGSGTNTPVVSLDLLCDGPTESTTADDCDDTDPARSPTLAELPYDGVDNDCDPATPDDDLDGDGFLAADDCDDDDPSVNPNLLPPVYFTDETAASGLWSVAWDRVLHPATCGSEGMSGSASAADYDGDGWTDLFVPRQHEPDQLFRNQGDGTFVDVAAAAGIVHAGQSSMGVWADLDGDTHLDLFVVSHGKEGNRLYLNDGDGSFTEVAGAGGMEMPIPTGCSLIYGVSAADVDGDGDLDIHTNQWHGGPNATGDRSRLFLNDGSANFTDATLASGLDLFDRAAFATSFGDLDDDGDVDLALAADWMESGLWLNDGLGSFTEVTATAGVGLDQNGMGSDLGDMDGDGDLDWFVTAIYDETLPCPNGWDCGGNFLYANDGSASFTDDTDRAGVRDGAWGWGASFLDFDNDGDLDLGHTNGFHLDPEWQQDPVRLFVNDGTATFSDQACALGVQLRGEGKAFVAFDADNDGDLDVFTTLTNAEPRLYINQGGDANSWLRVLASEPGNAFGIGARVDVTAVSGGPSIRVDIDANGTFMGHNPPEAHVGLAGHETPIHEVRITWPDGAQTVLNDVPPRQILSVAR